MKAKDSAGIRPGGDCPVCGHPLTGGSIDYSAGCVTDLFCLHCGWQEDEKDNQKDTQETEECLP